jgi:hypothetical protein
LGGCSALNSTLSTWDRRILNTRSILEKIWPTPDLIARKERA